MSRSTPLSYLAVKTFQLLLFCLAAPLLAQTPAAQTYRERLSADVAAETATVYTIIFDTSGSMKGTKIVQAKEAFATWLSAVQPGNVWSVYRFSENVGLCALPFTPDGQAKAADLIKEFNADASTPIVATLGLASEAIFKRRVSRPYESHVLLLFTDGNENVDKRGNPSVIEAINSLKKTGIEVVGIGYAGEGDYMRPHASRYYNATDGSSLRQGLAEVETEIDPLAPVQITEEERRLMQNISFPSLEGYSPSQPSPSSAAPSVKTTSSTSPVSAQSDPISLTTIVIFVSAVLGVLFLRKVFSC